MCDGAGKDYRRTSVSATAGQAQDERGQAERLGIKPGQVVQEIGYDDDCDEQLRGAITQVDGVELVDEDYDDVVDVVLLWWRDGDGDLVDALVDALTPLADHGVIWLLTPKAARVGHVEPSDVSEAAPTAGLQQTSSISAAGDWNGARLVAPKAARGKGRGTCRRLGARPPTSRCVISTVSYRRCLLVAGPVTSCWSSIPLPSLGFV